MDKNDYYGAECASLTLDQAWKHFGEPGELPKELGSARSYNIDVIPKALMANGKLVKILLHTDVTRYLEFKSIAGSYVLKERRIHKVPATEKEALGSKLLGFFEKKRFKDFLTFVAEYDVNNPKTHGGIGANDDTAKMMKKYKLDTGTIDIVGHALALYSDESWLERPARETIERVALYMDSLRSYGKSPYLYPVYGLGDLPQSFARLAAIYGGTYMLNKPIDGVVIEDGKVVGVKSEGEVAKAPLVIGDPSYFEDRVKQVGAVARCYAILDHPIGYTNDSESVQVILPQNQVGRKHDIYISAVSDAHQVVPKGKFLAIVSTEVESEDWKKELDAGVKYLGNTLHKFYSLSPMFESTKGPGENNIHISKSYDASSHFETIADDVMRIYKQVTG